LEQNKKSLNGNSLPIDVPKEEDKTSEDMSVARAFAPKLRDGQINIKKVAPKKAKPFYIPKGVPIQYLKGWESWERKNMLKIASSEDRKKRVKNQPINIKHPDGRKREAAASSEEACEEPSHTWDTTC